MLILFTLPDKLKSIQFYVVSDSSSNCSIVLTTRTNLVDVLHLHLFASFVNSYLEFIHPHREKNVSKVPIKGKKLFNNNATERR